jgi:UDP-N-acetylmuramoyl-tripeptide--D-alanyl-D-alanine ligase
MPDIIWQLVSFLSFFFFLWLLVRLLVSLLFWWYLWQRKEYRWDRLLAHFSLSQGRHQLLQAFNPFALPWRRPQLTLRLLLLAFFSLAGQYQLYFWLLRFFSRWVRQWPILLFPVFSVALLVTFWLAPFLVGLTNGLVYLLFWPLHRLVIQAAKQKLVRIKPLVVGITGSFGKSTTKEILKQVLATKFKVVATDGSVNTLLGIAKTILRKLRATHEVFIVEMGAYKAGEIRQLARMVRPTIGIITGINPQHGQLFGSQEKIAQAKYELIEQLPKTGLAVFNGDNKIALALSRRTAISAVKVYHQPTKPYKTKLLGRFQQLNIQAALSVADYLEVDRTRALEAIENLELSEISLRLTRGRAGCLVLNDSRNSNPDGFWEALEVLASLSAERKLVVTSGVVELGPVGPVVHRRLGKRIAQVADELILTSNNYVADFKRGAGEAFADKITVAGGKASLASLLKKRARLGVVFLLEGWNWEAKKVLLNKKSQGRTDRKVAKDQNDDS